MNILITGGNGFLGKHLTKFLKKKKTYKVISLSSKDADLRLSGSLSKLNKIKFKKIYHLAAWSQAGKFSLYHPGEQWLNNQLINSNLLNWIHKHQIQAKLITIGTNLSYEEGTKLNEKEYLSGYPIETYSSYAMSKRMLLIGQKAMAKQFGLKFLTLVPATLYGQGYEINKKEPHFIFDIIQKILKAKKNNTKVELWGDGSQKRELLHVKDFIKIMLSLENRCENDVVNIATKKEYEIKYYAKIICKIIEYPFKQIKFNQKKFIGPKSKKLLTKKLEKYVPSYKFTTLNDGLLETIKYLKKII